MVEEAEYKTIKLTTLLVLIAMVKSLIAQATYCLKIFTAMKTKERNNFLIEML
jgi:hypothetical protein